MSPRGEGLFRTDWVLRGNGPEAGTEAAESFASPGKLAIVYGVPEKVEDGTVVLRYRFLRVVDADGLQHQSIRLRPFWRAVSLLLTIRRRNQNPESDAAI